MVEVTFAVLKPIPVGVTKVWSDEQGNHLKTWRMETRRRYLNDSKLKFRPPKLMEEVYLDCSAIGKFFVLNSDRKSYRIMTYEEMPELDPKSVSEIYLIESYDIPRQF